MSWWQQKKHRQHPAWHAFLKCLGRQVLTDGMKPYWEWFAAGWEAAVAEADSLANKGGDVE